MDNLAQKADVSTCNIKCGTIRCRAIRFYAHVLQFDAVNSPGTEAERADRWAVEKRRLLHKGPRGASGTSSGAGGDVPVRSAGRVGVKGGLSKGAGAGAGTGTGARLLRLDTDATTQITSASPSAATKLLGDAKRGRDTGD